jgi:tetratricopeptide (TPR) repeat protein
VKPVGRAKTQWIFIFVLLILVFSGSLRPLIDFTLGRVVEWMPQLEAESFDQRVTRADEALSQGQWALAEGSYTEALAIVPDSHECLYGRAVARSRQADWQAALGDVDQAIALHVSPDYHRLRASILRHIGRHDEAAEDEAVWRSLTEAGREKTDSQH